MERPGTDGDTQDLASDETLDASDASRAPVVRPTKVERPPDPDYAGLIEVDPKHYLVGDELARGGMGRIVRAHDRRLARDVAIKELLPRREDHRFEREARITARLAHPAIVAIHEAGRWPNGSPFFAMKLVAGESLDVVIRAKPAFRDRLALVGNVIDAVDALAYAHSEHVIHRDLKPGNILVGKYGETVVIDWGLAKDLDTVDDTIDVDAPDYEPTEGETVFGAVMGTPQYMSPEQADGARVDARTDVYALGALLYHVLAGRPPYEGTSTAEVLQRVLEEPPKPLGECSPETPMELIAIVERAMARDTKLRFQNAGEMAEELRRFQTGQLIKSHRYTVRELVRRWVVRNRTPIAVGAVAFIALAAVGVTSVVKIVSETHRADHEAAVANDRADVGTLERARSLLEADPSQALAALRDLSRGSPHWREARMIIADAEARGTAQVFQSDGGGNVSHLAWNADGTLVAAAVAGELMAWDPSAKITYRLPGPTKDPQASIGWDGDDVIHVTASGKVSRWHCRRGGNDPIIALDGSFFSISPNGRWAVAEDELDEATLIELATNKRRSLGQIRPSDQPLRVVGWEANSAAVMIMDNRSSTMRRTELATGSVTTFRTSMDEEVYAVAAFGNRTVLSSNVRPLFLAGAPFSQQAAVLPTGFSTFGEAVSVMPDGTAVAISSNANTTVDAAQLDENVARPFVWISDGSDVPVKLVGHRTALTALAVSLQGRIASADYQGHVRVWSRVPQRYSTSRHVLLSAFARSNRTEIVAMEDDAAERIELATGSFSTSNKRTFRDREPDRPEPERDALSDHQQLANPGTIVPSATGEQWITQLPSGRAWVWDHARSSQLCRTAAQVLQCAVEQTAISADGSRVAAFANGDLAMFDASGRQLPIADIHFNLQTAIALSPSGSTIAVAARTFDEANTVYLYDAKGGAIGELPLRASSITAMTWLDETRLAVAFDSSVHVIDVRTAAQHSLDGHEAEIASIRIADDGRVVTISADNTARIWNLTAGTSQVLRGHTKRIRTVDVVGDVAVTTSLDGTARLWDLVTEQSRPLPNHATQPVLATISSTGDIVVLDSDGRLSHYTDNAPWGEASLRGWIDALTNTR